ncbi:putative aromatic acid decarboxylase [Planctomycetes bacterium Pan216]|uniref:Flavin prenyltransferase UbiX n=1 Tax=Kolteria novifilia TaxID=2527975 RepID=A0A518B567_9BACT|nr:putative aromatic acid decarboxylase [Planctomycetes bacterium Pan216]
MADHPLVVAITGASGFEYGRRLLEVLLLADREVHLVMSPSAALVAKTESGRTIELEQFTSSALIDDVPADRLHYWRHHDFMAPVASGSFQTSGMAIVPCSMGTLATISQGLQTNLIHRAADVHLKERRPLVLTPRETPLSLISLENMTRVTRAGATVLPAMPGFYHKPQRIDDLIDFIVARICDHLGIDAELTPRWGKPKS